jgi:hypothetical protein
MAGIFLQNVSTSHPSRWIRIQKLTFGDCIVVRSMPIAHDTLPVMAILSVHSFSMHQSTTVKWCDSETQVTWL